MALKSFVYIGRFAPSPSGPLHLGSVVAALASWLDARAAGPYAQWLVRIEDVDVQRCKAEYVDIIMQQLNALGLIADAAPKRQSQRYSLYAQALEELKRCGLAYPCDCTRRDIEQQWARLGAPRERFATLIYPGTCAQRKIAASARMWRFNTSLAAQTPIISWIDRRLGRQKQNVARAVGDFSLLRENSIWSYQLACVVDDSLQGVTHIVRGEDLTDNTARQIVLQKALLFKTPKYLHIPLAIDVYGEKLSKSNGALAADISNPLQTLLAAAQVLQLSIPNHQDFSKPFTITDFLQSLIPLWVNQYGSAYKQ